MASSLVKIAIDGMGGDNAPNVQAAGIRQFLEEHPNESILFKVFGDENVLKKHFLGLSNAYVEIVHTDRIITSDMKPSAAVRASKGSSMRMAIESVANGECNASISCGNTGALMALSKLILKTASNIDRPAICAMMPTKKGKCVLLDMGANIDVSARNLFEFAVMGNIFAQIVLHKRETKIALLNIGSEDKKGHAYIQEAHDIISNSFLKDNFRGYIEPNEIYDGDIDVIVTDGFTGNVVIKSAEGLGRMMKVLLKNAFSSSVFSMAGYGLSKGGIGRTMQIMDPNNYNGGMFIGLNGVSVKSHGGADENGFCNAIGVTTSIVRRNLCSKIQDSLEKIAL